MVKRVTTTQAAAHRPSGGEGATRGRTRSTLGLAKAVCAALTLLSAPTPALSSDYEVLVIERRWGSSISPPVASDAGPFAAAASGSWPGINSGSGHGAAVAESASAIVTLGVGASGSGFVARGEGEVVAIVEVDDIVFSGPASTVDVSMNVEWGGFADVVESGSTSTWTLNRSVQAEVRALSGPPYCIPGAAGDSATGADVGTFVLTTPVRSCPTGVPIVAWFRFELRGLASASAPGDLASVSADASNGASLATSGPVFNLPPGFTANSLDGSIVDNVYVPEPHVARLLLPGLFTLACFARARSRRYA